VLSYLYGSTGWLLVRLTRWKTWQHNRWVPPGSDRRRFWARAGAPRLRQEAGHLGCARGREERGWANGLVTTGPENGDAVEKSVQASWATTRAKR
jgi:hypothetical protein